MFSDSEICADEDVYEEEEATPSKFNEVYSDTESEEGEEEEEEWVVTFFVFFSNFFFVYLKYQDIPMHL